MNDKIKRCREVMEDILISIRNHHKDLTLQNQLAPEYRRSIDRLDALQTALEALDELTKVRGELENFKQKLALIVSNPETATGNIMAKIIENKDLKINKLQAQLEDMKHEINKWHEYYKDIITQIHNDHKIELERKK